MLGGPKFRGGSAWGTPKVLGGARGQVPAGTDREEAPGGREGVCLGPGGPPGTGSPEKRPGPPPSPGFGRHARARLPPTPHFPSVQAARPAGRARSGPRRPPRSGIWASVAAPPAAASGPPLRLGAPGSLPSRTRRPAYHPPALPAPRAGGGRRGRGRVVECATRRSGSAALFPPPPLRSPAAR